MRPPSEEELENATEDEKKLFKFAIGIDHAAKELIRHAISVAAERSVDLVKPWLEEAYKANLNVTAELRITRFLAEGLLEDLETAEKEARLDRIERLEEFANEALRRFSR